MRVRTMRFFSRASVVGAVQTDFKSIASVVREAAFAHGIRRVILTEGTIGCVVRSFKVAPKRVAHLVPPRARALFGGHGGGDGAGANHVEQRVLNSVIDTQTAEGDAARLATIEPPAIATVARNSVLRPCVSDNQLTSAAVTADQPCQQGVTMLGCAMMTTGGNIAAHHGPDRFSLLPADIALVGVWHQCQPFIACLAAGLHADAMR